MALCALIGSARSIVFTQALNFISGFLQDIAFRVKVAGRIGLGAVATTGGDCKACVRGVGASGDDASADLLRVWFQALDFVVAQPGRPGLSAPSKASLASTLDAKARNRYAAAAIQSKRHAGALAPAARKIVPGGNSHMLRPDEYRVPPRKEQCYGGLCERGMDPSCPRIPPQTVSSVSSGSLSGTAKCLVALYRHLDLSKPYALACVPRAASSNASSSGVSPPHHQVELDGKGMS